MTIKRISQQIQEMKFPIGAWILTVGVPMVYLFMLIGLSAVDPFGTGPFSLPLQPGSMSISSMLGTPQANGGFAVFSSPTIVYMWTNPVTTASRSWSQKVGAFFFTVGWTLSVLLPTSWAPNGPHAVGFAFGIAGAVVLSIGFCLTLKGSPVMLGWTILLVIVDVVAIATFEASSTTFIAFEYIVAFVTASVAPLAVSIVSLGGANRRIVLRSAPARGTSLFRIVFMKPI